MRDSTTYQAILDEGRAEGRTEEARELVLRLGRKRWGEPETTVVSALKAINHRERLESMAEGVNEVAGWQDLLQTP
jgi:hypothetical protein